MKTISTNIRIDEDVKKQADALFEELGLNMSTAINIFLRQALSNNGLPFEIKAKRPNAVTLSAMRETQDIIDGKIPAKSYSSVDELFEDLENGI